MRFLEQDCTMSEQFNNLFPTRQIQIMHTIQDKEETYVYTMIRPSQNRLILSCKNKYSYKYKKKKWGKFFK